MLHKVEPSSTFCKNFFQLATMKFVARQGEHTVQYVALGPRVKVIILNILPELKPDGLQFSLKIDLMSLAIIAK